MRTVSINRSTLTSFVVIFDSPALEARFNFLELFEAYFTVGCDSGSSRREGNRGECGSLGFGDDVCAENLSVPEV